jgi:hypothetical protein
MTNECLNHMQQDRMAKVCLRDLRESEQVKGFDKLGETLEALQVGAGETHHSPLARTMASVSASACHVT